MAGLRPVVLTAETLDFYRGFERNPRWECKLSSAQLHERGKQPSHFCLEGWQSKRGEQIHAGVLHVPDEDLRILAAQASRVQTYLHEIKSSPAHPAFFDVDMAVSPFNDLFWKMIVAVIERAELNHEEIACATMQEYLKMPSLHPETSTLPYGILERLRASKPFVPNATGDEKWTWLDVARCGLDETEPSGVFGDATHPNVIRPLVCVFLMAISKLIQRVCLSFYPDIAKTDTDTKMQTFVLTNYEAETHSINFPENDKRETKLGAHVYLRQLYVDTHTQLYIWQALVDLFTGSFAEVPCADGPHAFWTSVFDAAPYTSKVGVADAIRAESGAVQEMRHCKEAQAVRLVLRRWQDFVTPVLRSALPDQTGQRRCGRDGKGAFVAVQSRVSEPHGHRARQRRDAGDPRRQFGGQDGAK